MIKEKKMPIYEYNCKNCREKFEEFQSIGADNEDLICPKCSTPRPERIFSSFSSSSTSGFREANSDSCSSSSPFT